MDVHFFRKQSCLAVISRDAVLFVRQSGVHQHLLSEEFSGGIDCVSFDEINSRVALSCKRNIAIVSLPADEANPVCHFTVILERNCSTMCWSPTGHELVAGDKSGGIWVITPKDSASSSTLEPTLIGSRVAVVLALCICGSESSKFLAVGDRDGRLSIFHYPATHNLHQVCLGHSQFIAALAVPDPVKWPHHVMSLGGDGVICLWNIITGSCAARVALFDENSFVLCQNRPKYLLLINSTTTADNKHTVLTWLVFGEDSTSVYAFSLVASDDSGQVRFELKLESFSAFLGEISFEAPVSAAAVVSCVEGNSSVIVVTGSAGKSLWPWKVLDCYCDKKSSKSSLMASILLEKLKGYLATNNSDFVFSIRPPRLWLERHPHHHVAEYYAKRKKNKVASTDNGSDPVQVVSDSDSSENEDA